MSGKGGGGSGGGSGNGKGSNGLAGVPAVSRKMVQSLKEIVSNFPEHEIYAMLKECGMDPNEAVSRLLSQDPFHEVKSKREKKKEHKDIPDSRSRATNYSSSRGGRTGTDRYAVRAGTNQFNSSGTDYGLLQGRPVYKKENGTNAPGGPTSSSGILGNSVNWQLPYHSDSAATELCAGDGLSSSSQHGGLQSAWMGVQGQVTMADIVKMGRPQAKASVPSSSINTNNHHNVLVPPSTSQQSLHPLHVSEANSDQGFPIGHDVCQNDEWPSIEHQSGASASSITGVPLNSEYYGLSTNLDEANQQQRSHLEEQLAEDTPVETADNVGPASISAKSITEDNAGGASVFDDILYEDKNPYQPHRHPFNNNEAEDGISSMVAHMEQLNLQKDDQVEEPEEENDSVVIPDHLQLHNPECLNLSFGSFGSGTNAGFPSSGPYASRPVKSNPEETSAATDVATIVPSDSRDSDYCEDEHLTGTSEGNLVQRTDVSAGPYGSSMSQPEVLKPESPPEAIQGNQYSFPSSSREFTYDNSQQPDVPYSHPQTNSQMQNLASFSSVMGYTNSLPSALLASTVQPVREDIPYSPFPVTQSMAAKYSNIAPSIGASTISMSEALRASSISTPQPNPQTLPGASVATGPSLPQHMAVHPYSQPTFPLGHFANMISYPFLPQSYTYMPSAFQQAFPGNSTYHQSLAAALPQYKNSVSVSSMPQSAAVASGYGFGGSSTSVPGGNFPLNPPAAPVGSTIGYEDVLNSQFKDTNLMISLQQNENSPMWVHGPASRTMSAVPGSTYYSFQGQNQQSSGFRQSQQQQQQQQQPSQHFGPPGYPNYYSQTGISPEHLHHHQQQQQTAREASLAGVSQVPQPSKQSQQLWHNNY